MKKIAVLGAGNGACSRLRTFRLRGFPVTLYSRPGSKTLKAVEEEGRVGDDRSPRRGLCAVREVTNGLETGDRSRRCDHGGCSGKRP